VELIPRTSCFKKLEKSTPQLTLNRVKSLFLYPYSDPKTEQVGENLNLWKKKKTIDKKVNRQ
jgi:hypothetical protein